MTEAIKTCLVKTGDMNGRASRSEFWWSFFSILRANDAQVFSSSTFVFTMGMVMA
ncbi:MAG: hypothetical protein ACJZ5P_06480 [Candidatus Thalassarchaeaceae archaeon]